jgi:glucose-6-phosphate 1-epimerase
MKRRITIAKRGSDSTIVWNPWVQKARAMPDFGDDEWPRMLCIETANVGDAAVTLRPEDRHTMTAEISVEAAE